MTNPFYSTRDFFKEATLFDRPLSYDEWMNCPDDHKAAVLYLQFFDQITLAWYKVRSFYGSEEEGVETMMQYLVKNVPIIEKDPKKFTARYIYRVAYNCLYCICHDRLIDKQRYELEVSNICVCSETGDSLDLFDTVPCYDDPSRLYEKKELWEAIQSLGQEAALVAEMLCETGKIDKKMREAHADTIDKLAEVLVQYA